MYIVLSCGKTTLSKNDKGIYSNVLNSFNYLLHATNCSKSRYKSWHQKECFIFMLLYTRICFNKRLLVNPLAPNNRYSHHTV